MPPLSYIDHPTGQVSFIRTDAHLLRYGAEAQPEARAVYRDITSQIKSRLVLKESSDYLENFSPTNNRGGEILKRQEYLREALRRVKPGGLKELIKRVRFIRFTRDYLHDRVLIVDESEVETARKLGLCDVTTNPEEAEGYPLVLSTIGYGIDVELLPSQVAPELYVLPLWENRETLKALEEIGKLTGEGSVAGEILKYLAPFGKVVEKEKLLGGSLDELIAEKERELNERIEEKLEKFSLTLTGRDLVKFLNELREGNYEAIFSHFREIEGGEILDMINEAEGELSKVLGLHVELFSREELYPVRIPPEVVEGLRTELERELKVEVYMKAREIAEKVRPLLPKLREELSKIRELDFLQAVKAFTEGFTFPEIAESGIAFLNGRHLFIENPQPVSYVVGGEKPKWFDVPGAENVRGGENVVILTGANSGGKTSLLELITQVPFSPTWAFLFLPRGPALESSTSCSSSGGRGASTVPVPSRPPSGRL